MGLRRETKVLLDAGLSRPHGLPMDQLLVNGVDRGRNNLKLRLIRIRIKEEPM
jgi:hypothetical protein